MSNIQQLLVNNREWAAARLADDPEFFSRNAESQSPPYLWIGCADSRAPAATVTGLPPGELFVHRNIANCVPDGDTSSASVIQYAVAALKVQHIIVCGHYACGGVKAALDGGVEPPLDDWIAHIRKVRDAHADELQSIADDGARWRRLCELNVLAQARNVSGHAAVQAAGDALSIHTWIYDLATGRLNEIDG